jgi:hypothetical protein
MTRRWSLILPILGLILFGAETVRSIRDRQDQARQQVSLKYFYWSFLSLDSDPLNRNLKEPSGLGGWKLQSVWIDPGYMTQALMVSAFPAFIVGIRVVKALGHFGLSEVLSFFIAMPLLIFTWFYCVGWRIDAWVHKPSHALNKAKS